MKSFLRFFAETIIGLLKFFYYRILSLRKLCFTTKYYAQRTYYPEYADHRKSKIRIWFEQFMNIMKYGYINDFYFLYGFDINGFRKQDEYVDYSEFRTRRNKLTRSLTVPVSILRNKYVFGMYCKSININTPTTIGFLSNEYLFLAEQQSTLSIDKFLLENNVDIFCKLIDGECGQGVMHIASSNGSIFVNNHPSDITSIKTLIGKGRFVVQQTISNQHHLLSNLFPNAVNTMRLVTIYDANSAQCVVLPSPLLRVGCGDNIVDNWAVGGLIIGINDDGTLHKYGFYKPSKGTKVTTHPDTGISFEGYQIPYFQEAIEMAKRFHMNLPGIHSIGWDIAFTDNGPVFIEGNDNWEISMPQCCADRGIRKEFEHYFPK